MSPLLRENVGGQERTSNGQGGSAPVNSKASCSITSITNGFALWLCFSCFLEASPLKLFRFRHQGVNLLQTKYSHPHLPSNHPNLSPFPSWSHLLVKSLLPQLPLTPQPTTFWLCHGNSSWRSPLASLLQNPVHPYQSFLF